MTETWNSIDGRPHLLALGQAVRELRARRGLTQERLGEGADTHRNYVGAIERGEINPTFRVLIRLARGLYAPLTEIVAAYQRQLVDAARRAGPAA